MNANMKITIAVLLIICAAGVVGVNTYRVIGSGPEDASPAEEPFFDLREPAPMEANATRAPWKDDAPRTTTFDGRSAPEAARESPLGDAWNGTVWEQLIQSYIKQSEETGAASRNATVTARPLTEENDLYSSSTDFPGPRQIAAPVSASVRDAFAETDHYTLRGILYSSAGSSALIDGWIFHPGDTLPGGKVRITAITRDQVLLEHVNGQGDVVEKRLAPMGIRRSHRSEQGREAPSTGAAETEKPAEFTNDSEHKEGA